jgi:hypothetical protein
MTLATQKFLDGRCHGFNEGPIGFAEGGIAVDEVKQFGASRPADGGLLRGCRALAHGFKVVHELDHAKNPVCIVAYATFFCYGVPCCYQVLRHEVFNSGGVTIPFNSRIVVHGREIDNPHNRGRAPWVRLADRGEDIVGGKVRETNTSERRKLSRNLQYCHVVAYFFRDSQRARKTTL